VWHGFHDDLLGWGILPGIEFPLGNLAMARRVPHKQLFKINYLLELDVVKYDGAAKFGGPIYQM
jgi:hypothetical protein